MVHGPSLLHHTGVNCDSRPHSHGREEEERRTGQEAESDQLHRKRLQQSLGGFDEETV